MTGFRFFFQKSLCLCALDEISFSSGRVKVIMSPGPAKGSEVPTLVQPPYELLQRTENSFNPYAGGDLI